MMSQRYSHREDREHTEWEYMHGGVWSGCGDGREWPEGVL